MSGTTIRIRTETRATLRELERATGQGTQELLARAVDQLRRTLVLEETNAAYAALRADAAEWSEVERERDAWEATLRDGLDH
jgi:hypothetical protein